MPDNEIVCRCSDLSKQDIKNLIEQGYTTFDEIKRISRAGMGPCQGRNCMPLIMKEISKITGKPTRNHARDLQATNKGNINGKNRGHEGV